jgi:hypothetical protein
VPAPSLPAINDCGYGGAPVSTSSLPVVRDDVGYAGSPGGL